MRIFRWSIGATALALLACSEPTGIELQVDYPSNVARLTVAQLAPNGAVVFEPQTFEVEFDEGPISRRTGSIVILLADDLADTVVTTTVAGAGEDNGTRVFGSVETTVRAAEITAAEVTLRGCGDGEGTGDEVCDDGNGRSGDGCDATCRPEPGFVCGGFPSVCEQTCGDGVTDTNELCDDMNVANDDGCSANCVIEAGYVCDGQPSICTVVCGDGTRAGPEACDDRNTVDGDGCAMDCTIEPGWTCDDDGCRPICGDRLIRGLEQCDDGGVLTGDGCDAMCRVEDGYICEMEPSQCDTDCGDGVIAGDEACDDDNTLDDDGCSALCAIEAGFTCVGQPSVCENCANGVVEGTETCDDENTVDGDGCSSTCAVEPGCQCEGTPSVCGCCGDGVLGALETCDDGNTMVGDGCDAQCAIEPDFGCINYDPSRCYRIADTTFVDGTSSNCPGTGTLAEPYCLYQDGIDGAFDTVVVAPATYDEAVQINGRTRTVLVENGAVLSGLAASLVVSGGSAATTYNLTVSAAATPAAIVIDQGTVATFVRTSFESTAVNGVDVSGSARLVMRDCDVTSGAYGVHVFDLMSAADVTGGTITAADQGVRLESGAEADFADVTIVGGARGTSTRGAGSTLTLRRATVRSNTGVGIRIEGGSRTNVETSTVFGGDYGLHQNGGGSYASVTNSDIRGDTNGIYIDDGTADVMDTYVEGGSHAFHGKTAAELVTATRVRTLSRTSWGVYVDDGLFVIEGSMLQGALGGVFVTKAMAELTVRTSSIGPTPGIGVHVMDGDFTLDRSYIFANDAGGVLMDTNKDVRVTNNFVVDNGGPTSAVGGVAYTTAPASSVFVNNTVAQNESADAVAAGIDCANSTIELNNTIVWDNDNGDAMSPGVGTSCDPRSCDLQTNASGTNISIDPLFVDAAAGDYHLQPTSSCIDRGDDNDVPANVTLDFDGDARIAGNAVDIGADEVR